MNRRELGQFGERWAGDYLEGQGYRVKERNFRCRLGEIDIVAEYQGSLVFVEVRTRSGPGFGAPEESVTAGKRRRLISLAMAYMQSHRGLPSQWRIDVVAVEVDRAGKVTRTELIQNATG